MMDDHLQASEAEVVGAVVRWGEVVVARRGEGEVGIRSEFNRMDLLCICATFTILVVAAHHFASPWKKRRAAKGRSL